MCEETYQKLFKSEVEARIHFAQSPVNRCFPKDLKKYLSLSYNLFFSKVLEGAWLDSRSPDHPFVLSTFSYSVSSLLPDAKSKKERKKKKKVTNIISFDDEEDEQNSGEVFKKTPGAGESSEENSDRSSVNIMSAFESPFGPNSNGSQSSNSWKIDSLSLNGEFGYQKLDVKSIDDEDVDENGDDVYGNPAGRKHSGPSESPEK